MASCIVFPAVPLLKLKANCLHCWLLQAPTRSSFCSYSNIWDICQKYFLAKYFQFLNSSASGKLFLGCCQAHLIVSNLTWAALSKITLENSWQDSPLQICGVCWRVFFFVFWGGGEYIIYPGERQYGTPDQYHGTRTLRTGRGKNLTTHKFSTLISNSWTRMAKKKSFSTCFFSLNLSDQAFKGVIDGVKVLHSQHTSNERQNDPTFCGTFFGSNQHRMWLASLVGSLNNVSHFWSLPCFVLPTFRRGGGGGGG